MDGGLVLSRRVGESVIVRDRTTGRRVVIATVTQVRGNIVRLHFSADMDIEIWRSEHPAANERHDPPGDSTIPLTE